PRVICHARVGDASPRATLVHGDARQEAVLPGGAAVGGRVPADVGGAAVGEPAGLRRGHDGGAERERVRLHLGGVLAGRVGVRIGAHLGQAACTAGHGERVRRGVRRTGTGAGDRHRVRAVRRRGGGGDRHRRRAAGGDRLGVEARGGAGRQARGGHAHRLSATRGNRGGDGRGDRATRGDAARRRAGGDREIVGRGADQGDVVVLGQGAVAGVVVVVAGQGECVGVAGGERCGGLFPALAVGAGFG